MNKTIKEFKRGDIWTVETDRGIEKAMIISNDVGNKMADIVTVAYMESGFVKRPTHMQIGTDVVMFENIATYAKERLLEKEGEVKRDFSKYLNCSVNPFTVIPKRCAISFS